MTVTTEVPPVSQNPAGVTLTPSGYRAQIKLFGSGHWT
jgi:hypothetical protein